LPADITLDTYGLIKEIWLITRKAVNPTIIAPCIMAAIMKRLVQILDLLLLLSLIYYFHLKYNVAF
jgi:hypothetical protein